MTYTLIGSGNMATFIASRMLAGGHTCAGVWARNTQALDALCVAFSLPRIASLKDLHDGTDACILAVSDAAIPDLVKELRLKHTTLIHTAGSVSIGALSFAAANCGVVWPVYSIRKAAMPAHRAFPALIEGNTQAALEAARGVARSLCDTIYEASSEQRQWLHLSAVISNNFVNHLLGIATTLASEHGLPAALLQPLTEQTIANLRTHPASEMQTGPAHRGDMVTIKSHLQMLEVWPDLERLYDTISRSIMSGRIGYSDE